MKSTSFIVTCKVHIIVEDFSDELLSLVYICIHVRIFMGQYLMFLCLCKHDLYLGNYLKNFWVGLNWVEIGVEL